jgi:hypothetical protein
MLFVYCPKCLISRHWDVHHLGTTIFSTSYPTQHGARLYIDFTTPETSDERRTQAVLCLSLTKLLPQQQIQSLLSALFNKPCGKQHLTSFG